MRFCLFCGKEIPENAIFCPSCGGKQPQQEEKTETILPIEEDEEEDNAALNLLAKVNFSSTSTRTESIIPKSTKKTSKKVEKVEHIKTNKKVEEKKEDNIIPVNEYIPKNETIIKENTIQNEIEEDNNKDIIIVTEENEQKEEFDDLQQMFDDMEEDISQQEYIPPILTDLTEEMENKKESEEEKVNPSKVEQSSINLNIEKNKVQQKTKVSYKKRNLSEEDESEDEIINTSSMKTNSSLGFENMNDDLTADEKADLEKYKNYKKEDTSDIDDIDDNSISERGEGRKKNGRKKEARKNVDKEIAKRKFNIVEHEAVNKKEDIDPDYDGYYENVKPIDFDKQRDNSSLIKVILTAVSFVGLASIVFYMLITFFMQ